MTTRLKPSLTRAELHEIGQRRSAADIPKLLWDIARLHAIARRADQLLRSTDTSGVIRTALREELDELAIIQEDAVSRATMWERD
jgi:hypothetical protein